MSQALIGQVLVTGSTGSCLANLNLKTEQHGEMNILALITKYTYYTAEAKSTIYLPSKKKKKKCKN